jgi:hypothetical protein
MQMRQAITYSAPYGVDNFLNSFGDYETLVLARQRVVETTEERLDPVACKGVWFLKGGIKAPGKVRLLTESEVQSVLVILFIKHGKAVYVELPEGISLPEVQ